MDRRIWITCLLVMTVIVGGCWRDRSAADNTTRIVATGGVYEEPKWSPDGTKVVVIHSTLEVTTVEVLNMEGKLLQTTRGSGVVGGPAWVGGNARFLDGSSPSKALLMVQPQGSDARLSLPGVISATWSKDGRFAALKKAGIAANGELGSDLYLLEVKTGGLRPLWTEGNVREASISPTGHYVAFIRKEPSSYVLAVVDLEKGGIREAWSVPWPGNSIGGLTWSPDEAFIGVRRTGKTEDAGYFLVTSGGKFQPTRLTTVNMVHPDWSPSGDRLVFTTVGSPGENELRILQLPGNWRAKVQNP